MIEVEANRKVHEISSRLFSLDSLSEVVKSNKKLVLSKEATDKIQECRAYLDKKIYEDEEALFYGINTGFGYLQHVRIDRKEIQQLQYNLLQSHACGVGEKVPKHLVKIMLLTKIQSLAQGHSGVQLETVQRLIDFYNNDVLPVVYNQGSLGASGDLSPLSHLSLPLVGLGEVYHGGKVKSSQEMLDHFNWEPIALRSKEGLSLINGTQFMLSYGVHIVNQAQYLFEWADLIAAASLDGFNCNVQPFNHLIHAIRPHQGQLDTAAAIRKLLEGSEIAQYKAKQVQDPYSFRCIPQVHGASKDTLGFVKNTFEQEANAVTDNPNIFPEADQILSGGNFHGQPLALGFDYLSIAMAEIGSISERRTYQLLSGQRGLPLFLVNDPGLQSGLMIPQYTAASVVSENKQLCTPSSVDSIVSSNGQEDHVSMGANGATKCLRVLNNLEKILAIELLTAAQALDFRRPSKSSRPVEKMIAEYRKEVSFNTQDRVLAKDIECTIQFIRKRQLSDFINH
ncbi:histidine ammonia-lyase [Echinicola sp. CAU 1574]|uniref:Histidine ammonia-lyase n=1 Tax=Echinicola arenosa TaxID=2774144 RepID=A0ABR9ANF4_9BACT|nr:histidine ammonia-lyase [Echinicola arenosa]MBD8490305.1 histidine ammonia-lyase [Echinicola arenosa]